MAEGKLLVRDSRTSSEYEIPIYKNTVRAVDFKKINAVPPGSNKTAGLQVYDPGLVNTAIKETAISSRQPGSGLPTYRGYTTEQLWECDFEELFHLMAWGELPSAAQKQSFQRALAIEMTRVPPSVEHVVRSFPRSSLPMPMLLAGLSAYVASDPNAIPAVRGNGIYHGNLKLVDGAAIRTLAAYAVALGLVASHRKGIPFVPARVDRSFYENLFLMMGHVDPTTGEPNPVVLSCFRRAAILNADNGMTQSTFVLLAAASSLPDPISCLISALAAAYGPLHYGAQEAGYNNLKGIGGAENVPAFLEQVKKGERRLFGFGHRSFKMEDPRLAPVKQMLEELKANTESHPLLSVAYEIDRLASTDEYFVKRGLCANADFYTVFLFAAMGFESGMIAAANMSQRLIGLVAHWHEAMSQGIKLFRPVHIYTGSTNPEPKILSKL